MVPNNNNSNNHNNLKCGGQLKLVAFKSQEGRGECGVGGGNLTTASSLKLSPQRGQFEAKLVFVSRKVRWFMFG